MVEREILRFLTTKPGMSARHIGRLMHKPHSTILRYKKTVEKLRLKWSDVENMCDDAIVALFRGKRDQFSHKREPDWAYIHREMQLPHVTLWLLWEEYAMANPDDAYSYSHFAHRYQLYVKKLDITMRQLRRAGEKIFVDFAGQRIPWTDPQTGVAHKAHIFVAVVGCSSFTFACATATQSIADWLWAHERLLRFLGCRPEFLVCDNLKAAIRHAGPDPVINPIYLDFADHYEIVIDPARRKRPRDKAPVENGVLLVSRWLARLRHREFSSLAEINAAIAELLPVINEKPYKRIKGECRRSLFEKLDKPMMSPLRADPYVFAERVGPIKVDSSYHVLILGHSYSVPYTLAHERVEARVSAHTVEIFRKGRRVASHIRSRVIGGSTTLNEHHPAHYRQYAERKPERYVEWAATVGSAAVAAVQHQFADKSHPTHGMRACSTLQKLAKDHGPERFEAACRRAQAIGSLTVTSIRSILRRKLDLSELEIPTQTHLPLHENIRGAAYYATAGGNQSC